MLEADQSRPRITRRGSKSQSWRVQVVERLLPGPERGQRVVVDDEQYGEGNAQRGREGGLVAKSLLEECIHIEWHMGFIAYFKCSKCSYTLVQSRAQLLPMIARGGFCSHLLTLY